MVCSSDLIFLVFVIGIPSTILKTGVYYTMAMQSLPNQFLTWDNSTLEEMEFCSVYISDKLHPESTNEFKINNEWMFLPAEEVGWYYLLNRGQPNLKLSWGKIKNSAQNTSFVLVLKHTATALAFEDHYLFQPVRPNILVPQNKFQLKLKRFPDGVIKWSNITGLMNLEVIQHVNATNKEYGPYTEQFKSTLINIDYNEGKLAWAMSTASSTISCKLWLFQSLCIAVWKLSLG